VDKPALINALSTYAKCLGSQGKSAEALPLLQERLSLSESLPQSADEIAGCMEDIAVCQQNIKQNAAAAKLLDRALALRLKSPTSKTISGIIDKIEYDQTTNLGQAHQRLLNVINNSTVSTEAKKIALRTAARHCLNHRDPHSCNVALSMLQKLQPDASTDDSILTLRAQSLYLLGRTAQSLPLLQEALTIREKRIGPQARDVRDHRETLAYYYKKSGQDSAAEQLYLNALQEAERRADKPAIARSLLDLSSYYRALNPPDYPRSEDAQLRRLQVLEQIKGILSPDTVRARDALAATYLIQGKSEPAIDLYKKALAAAGTDENDRFNALNHLAVIYAATGNFLEAQKLLESLPPQSDPVAEQLRLFNLARIHGLQDHRDRQENYLSQFGDFCAKQKNDSDVLLGYSILASHYWRRGNYSAAAPLIEKEYNLARRLEAADRLISRVERERLARFYLSADNLEQAEQLLKQDIDPAALPYGATISVESILLSRLYEKQGKHSESESTLTAAIKRLPPSDRPVLLCTLATLYCSHSKPQEAIALLQKEIPTQPSPQRRNALNYCLAKAYLSAGNRIAARTVATKVLEQLNKSTFVSPADDRILFLPVTAAPDTENQTIPTAVLTGEVVATRKSNKNGCFEVYFLDDKEYVVSNNNRRIA
jgi:lipopolysaccharide biosynthesis regulator YciM